ncbi:MAG: KEOPS complex subunit Pcc1 [Candidatus Micrarchaeia archaeon]
MDCRGKLEFEFSSKKSAKDAEKAMGENASGRSSIKAKAEGKSLAVEIRAKDPVAMRAALNTCLRHIKVIDDLDGV